MEKYQAFLTCTGREATWHVTPNREVLPAAEGKKCGSYEDSNLFLCDLCLEYWSECTENELQPLWDFAFELRKKRQHQIPSGVSGIAPRSSTSFAE